MKLGEITAWLDRELEVSRFDDVSNNGLQIARSSGGDVGLVAFGVDASAAFVRRAAERGARLCVVHHGISWGGGIRRIVGSEYEVVRAAIEADVALYASHLPLDANERCGNNWEIARHLRLKAVEPAFSYHGNLIGVVGRAVETGAYAVGAAEIALEAGMKVGVCSGGAGEFAAEAKSLGCDLYLTGEASWGDVIAAENVGMKMVCAGHYETETFGVAALARALSRDLGLDTAFIDSRRGAAPEAERKCQ